MTKQLYGNQHAEDEADIWEPKMTVPEPGDVAAAAVLEAGLQRHLDFTAMNGRVLNEIRSHIALEGVPVLRNVASIASLKALAMSLSEDGAVCVVRDSIYTFGTPELLSGVSLFVFDTTSTVPETPLPGIPGAYLVVAPNAGAGRWVNVVAGVGWRLGATPTFEPRVARRLFHVERSSNGTGEDVCNVGSLAFDNDSGVKFYTYMTSGDEISLEFDFSIKYAGIASGLEACVIASGEVTVGVDLGKTAKRIGGPGSPVAAWNSVHLGGVYQATETAFHEFALGLKGLAGGVAYTYGAWSARGILSRPNH